MKCSKQLFCIVYIQKKLHYTVLNQEYPLQIPFCLHLLYRESQLLFWNHGFSYVIFSGKKDVFVKKKIIISLLWLMPTLQYIQNGRQGFYPPLKLFKNFCDCGLIHFWETGKHFSTCLCWGKRNTYNPGCLQSALLPPASPLPPHFAEESTPHCSSQEIFHVVVKRMMGAPKFPLSVCSLQACCKYSVNIVHSWNSFLIYLWVLRHY